MKRVSLHIAFWLAYLFQDVLLIFLVNTTRSSLTTGENLLLSIAHALVLLLPKIMFTYFMLTVALDKIIKEKMRREWTLYALLALALAILFYRGLLVHVINPFIYRWHDQATSFFYLLAFPVALMDIGFVAGVAIAIKQTRQQLNRTKLEQMLVKEKLETEIKFLRNQTNPHFLFNTLNNIYALARKKSDDTAGAVMKLSKLLRFMLSDASKPLITIGDEIRMLEDYIDLEKMRYNERLTISFLKDISDEQAMIAPLLLLPFVENAFKHGAGESRYIAYIDITLQLHNGMLKFNVKNTKENNGQPSTGPNIGLGNVKRQLELLYGEYDMRVEEEEMIFLVSLVINLNSYAKNDVPGSGR
jgi:two-component system LytT family sensor kinase